MVSISHLADRLFKQPRGDDNDDDDDDDDDADGSRGSSGSRLKRLPCCAGESNERLSRGAASSYFSQACWKARSIRKVVPDERRGITPD